MRTPEKEHPARRVLQGRAPGHARPARGPPARRRPVRLGHPGRRARPRSRHRRAPGPGRLQSAAALLSYDVPPPRAVGLAGQPLHLDQGGRPRVPCWSPLILILAGLLVLGRLTGPLGGARGGPGLPRPDRDPADLGPEPPVAVLPDLHPAALAQLAGARGVRHRRVRRSGRAVPARLAGRRVHPSSRWPPGSALPFALATACYTAYLFAQAKARDLWQSPLLAPHLAVQAVLAGAAATLAVRPVARPAARGDRRRGAAGRRGRRTRRCWCWARSRVTASDRARPPGRGRDDPGPVRALVLARPGRASRWRSSAPWIGAVAVPFALAGLLAHEHAYVQAGQSVPLA